jgi:microcystin-dependent protein
MKIVVDFERPSRLQRWTLRVGILGALVIGASAIAYADGLKSWTDGATLKAADLNGNFANLQSQLNALVPSGTIVAFAGVVDGNPGEMVNGHSAMQTPPSGWLLCDGMQLNGLDPAYAALYNSIGVSFGGTASSKAFDLPDLRGYFLRGLDMNAVTDPGAASRTALQPGGNSGATVGSIQMDALVSHSHGVTDPGHSHQYYSEGDGCTGEQGLPRQGPGSCVYAHTTSASATGISIQSAGGAETRPKNVAVNYLIKL